MDVRYPAEAETYREKVQAFLAEHLPAGWHGIGALDDEERRRFTEEWRLTLSEHGYLAVSWPKEYGGGGLTPLETVVLAEEFTRAGVPMGIVNDVFSIAMVGNTLLDWGTDEQKRHYLPRILSGEDRWCQGYSEPNAGSDLTALRTMAIEEGDYFVVNGSKIWTSQAHRTDWMFLLCRTDPKQPGSRGLSYILVDMKTPGLTTRPMVEINGQVSFNQVFFENVRVPKENLVGKKNEGWRVATTTLAFERNFGGRQYPNLVRDLARMAREVQINGRPAWEDSAVRQQIAAFMCEAEAIKYNAFRGITRRLKRQPPGPESSVLKLAGTELNLRIQMFAMEVLGPYAQLSRGEPFAVDGGKWLERAITARGGTIAGGSNQIQHNIIGERVLKLPR